MTSSIRNIGIVAHVDAGKTTLTEQMLFAAGALRTIGSVDKGTSTTDSLAIEKDRGISVKLATTSFEWLNTQINIIDTPGHVDFCSEVERSLSVLDGVVLVISAVEGVQGHSLTLFQALKSLKIPTLVFINKVDRTGADVNRVMGEINRDLSHSCLLIQTISGQSESDPQLENNWLDMNEKQENTRWYQGIGESIIEQDEELTDRYLANLPINFDELNRALIKKTLTCEMIPVLTGAAKNSLGIKDLLDAIVKFLPEAKKDHTAPLSAVVFKVERDKTLGKLAHIRVFRGAIKAKDLILNLRNKQQEKVSQLKKVVNAKFVNTNEILAGEIGVVSGLSQTIVGDIFGEKINEHATFQFSAPLLTVQAKPLLDNQLADLAKALIELTEEDPQLECEWLPVQRELHLKVSGKIQLEVLQAILEERFDINVEFSEPTIIYKETPLSTGFGYECYWMPKPCWAILKLKIEPGEAGSGVVYQSLLSVNDIAAKYQNEIEATINKALQQGPKGWQVTDIKITLIEGEDHNVHTRPGDYIIATPMAIMNGLIETDTGLLEPILDFSISASVDLLGSVTSDITKMRGQFEGPEFEGDIFILKGKVPAATSIDYPTQLASLSGGKAKISTRLSGYQACTLEQGVVTKYRGVSPLDRDKWILQARGAIS